MRLDVASLKDDYRAWMDIGVALPSYEVDDVRIQTARAPEWVHFGAGDIFRGFIGSLNQRLLEKGFTKTGIIACEPFDYEVIDRIYGEHDSLTLNVTLNSDGTMSREILAGIAEGVKADFSDEASSAHLREIFRAPSLKMLSFMITEKGYQLRRTDGTLMPVVEADMKEGPAKPRHTMAIVASLLLERFNAGALPLAVVSMDDCSHNGEKLRMSVIEIVEAWTKAGFVPPTFRDYVTDETRVSFPWTMIDTVAPRPHSWVQESLEKDGIEGMAPIVTEKKTFIAAFVSNEQPQRLVIEDNFPNGRLPLEKAGVCFCDREAVKRIKKTEADANELPRP